MAGLRRLSRGGAAVLAINALLAIAALGIAFAEPGGDEGPEVRLAAAGGSLSLSNSKEGAAIFHAVGMRPGEAVSGSVQIVNTGTVSGALQLEPSIALDAPGAGGGRLRNRLELVVVDVTDAQSPVTVYEGKLHQMDAVGAGTIGPGEARQYVVAAELKPTGSSDNAYQGASLVAGFTWTAVGGDAPTPTPTPTPTPSPQQAPAPASTPPAQATASQPPLSTPAPPSPAGGPAAADPTGAVLGAQVFRMPSSKRCASRRSFSIRVRRPRGMTFTSLRITVNRRTKVKLTGLEARRIKTRVNLRRLPKGRVAVKVVAVTTTGRKAISSRTYRTCAVKRKPR